ncbi:hypothetical protein [Parvicella tangerina]|uniref:YolD-like family protein n=1 Tax=Parvicella tangerina TaxID=2829795 RepID=A0A916JJE3_9FLAO|nr:hypothetical protein [Parvicella tangerina]CAG5076827.1 hypothetical protein CRYO30217_00213 [Parvicella tangerina]
MKTTTLAGTPTLIQKEDIPNLRFPKEPLQRSKDEQSILRKTLRDSMVLGNIHHRKIRIVFQDEEGIKEVRTTIWAADDRFIVLKKGVSIPVDRVVEITF